MSVTKTLNGCNMDTVKCLVQNPLIQILTLYQLCHSNLGRVHAADKTQTLTRCNILHALGSNVGNHVCVPLFGEMNNSEYTAYRSIFLLSAESVACMLCTRT